MIARLIVVPLLMVWACPLPAVTLRVSPAEFVVQQVPVGEACDLYPARGFVLTIQNDDVQAHIYELVARPPIAGSWQEGYAPIPDPGWLTFEPSRVTVRPGSTGQAKMSISVPAGDRHYNQHWLVSLAVEAAAQPGSILALAAYPRAYIETAAKQDVKENPLGQTAVAPSVVSLRESSQAPARALFRVFNNGSKRHSYRLRLATGARRIFPSAGRGWLANMAWLSVKPLKLDIAPGSSQVVAVESSVPEAYQRTMPAWEAVVFVEPERPGATETNFVRIQAKARGRTPQ